MSCSAADGHTAGTPTPSLLPAPSSSVRTLTCSRQAPAWIVAACGVPGETRPRLCLNPVVVITVNRNNQQLLGMIVSRRRCTVGCYSSIRLAQPFTGIASRPSRTISSSARSQRIRDIDLRESSCYYPPGVQGTEFIESYPDVLKSESCAKLLKLSDKVTLTRAFTDRWKNLPVIVFFHRVSPIQFF